MRHLRGQVGPLTWFIRTRHDFWGYVTPYTQILVREINCKVREHPLHVPLRPENRRMIGPLNTAVDYFVGWITSDSLDSVLERGATMTNDGAILAKFISPLLSRLRKSTSLKDPISQWKDKDLLARVFIIMAQMDIAFRTGRVEYVPSTKGLKELRPLRGKLNNLHTWFKRNVPDTLVDECLQVAFRLQNLLPIGQNIIYNPVFGAYGVINGSDGDLFADGTLYEMKCLATTKSVFKGDHIRQLLGYCVLNQLNNIDLPIERISLVNPRRDFKWIEDVDTVCQIVGATSFKFLMDQMQEELHKALSNLGSI